MPGRMKVELEIHSREDDLQGLSWRGNEQMLFIGEVDKIEDRRQAEPLAANREMAADREPEDEAGAWSEDPFGDAGELWQVSSAASAGGEIRKTRAAVAQPGRWRTRARQHLRRAREPVGALL
jgi:hypothetical protein